MAIDWNAIYQEEYKRLPDAVGTLQTQENNALDNLKNTYNTSTSRLADQLTEALRAAYVTEELSKRDLPGMLASQGITGGMTESTANDIMRDYRNSFNSSKKSHDNFQTDLDNAYATNTTNTTTDFADRIAQAQKDRASQATANAWTRYQAALAAEAAAAAASAQNTPVPQRTAPASATITSATGIGAAKHPGGYSLYI